MKKETPDDKIKYPTDLMVCSNCKNYTGKICSASNNKTEVSLNDECINGYFEAVDLKLIMQECYYNISEVIEYYMDIDDDMKNIISLWIMGTYYHENFNTYPYLFINAMRSSGKTRLLKIINAFSLNSQLINSITEATMFRTVGTLIIDEFEGLGGKGKDSLRELLNSSYKKGTKVLRMKKKKGLDGESQVVEEFEPYRPIVMANIWGMEEVLGDRCINLLLEKSTDLSKIKMVEDFDLKIINYTKNLLFTSKSVVSCRCSYENNIHQKWNNYIKERYITTYNNIHTYYTNNYTSIQTNENLQKTRVTRDLTELFKKIDETEIDGRALELFFPLFLIANDVTDEKNDLLNKTILFAKKLINEKKIDEVAESKDVLVYNMISTEKENEWRGVKELTEVFRMVIGDNPEWLNSKWMGRALKRLCLIKKKKRTGSGIQVILDIQKANLKKLMFSPEENE